MMAWCQKVSVSVGVVLPSARTVTNDRALVAAADSANVVPSRLRSAEVTLPGCQGECDSPATRGMCDARYRHMDQDDIDTGK